jgi:hypothetical protein
VIEGKLEERTEMTGRRGRRRKQLLDDLKEKRRYCKLKEEALDRTQWRTRFGTGYGPVVRQTTVIMLQPETKQILLFVYYLLRTLEEKELCYYRNKIINHAFLRKHFY